MGGSPTPIEFTVLGELATGGMGRIDLARRADDGTLLAVKRIREHLASDDRAVRMFLDEARIMAAVDHPNVVKLVAIGADDEGLFLATELVRGASLAMVARAADAAGESVPQDLAAYVVACAAAGLSGAHELCAPGGEPLGIVHRDVTLENVLVGTAGDVKISDFGIAKALFRMSETTTGALKGKVHYMSPEYVRGDPIDARSDLFSLGVVLYRLLSGRLPFSGDHEGQVLRKVMDVAPDALGPEIDPELAAVVEQLLAKNPANRAPKGARGVAESLGAWLEARGISTTDARRRLSVFVERYGAAREKRVMALLAGEAEAPADVGVATRTTLGIRELSEPSNETSDLVARATRRVERPAQTARGAALRSRVAIALAGVVLLVLVAVVFAARAKVATSNAATAAIGSSASSLVDVPSAPPASARATASPLASPVASASAPSVTTPSSAPKPSSHPSAHPSLGGGRAKSGRPCGPDDWDYPRCLQP